jgi:hypothetical protein
MQMVFSLLDYISKNRIKGAAVRKGEAKDKIGESNINTEKYSLSRYHFCHFWHSFSGLFSYLAYLIKPESKRGRRN